MVKPNVYFANLCNVQVQMGFVDSLQLAAKTVLGIVLEVNNRDGMVVSWSAHVVGCILPFLFINVEFQDRREFSSIWSNFTA